VVQENWPDWWDLELDCSNPHLAKRMIDRSFNEIELRAAKQLVVVTAFPVD